MHPQRLIVRQVALDEGVGEVDGRRDPFQLVGLREEGSHGGPGSNRTVVGLPVIFLEITAKADTAFELLDLSVGGPLHFEDPLAGDDLAAGVGFEIFAPGWLFNKGVDFSLCSLEELTLVGGSNGLLPSV